jgi:predicted transcriptional regulator of viral defense system
MKHCNTLDFRKVSYHIPCMDTASNRQEDRAVALLKERGMARLGEFIQEDITAVTISRMEQKGVIVQLARGLYQLADAPLDANHSLAEAAKLVPNGVICLSSALAFHELTDRIPDSVW